MLALLQTEGGLDVALSLSRPPEDTRRLRLSLAEGAQELDLARVSLGRRSDGGAAAAGAS